MNRFAVIMGATAVAAGLGMSGQTTAVTRTRDYSSHGAAQCQAALPVYDSNLRKGPLAIANEGGSTAFVTCDTESIQLSGFSLVRAVLVNRSTAALTVSCSLVDGVFGSNVSHSFPKSSGSIPVNNIGLITWTTADNAGANFAAPAFSCALPARMTITGAQFFYSEDVGA